jgi:hypothetical protein
MKHFRRHMLYALIISAFFAVKTTIAITHKSVSSGNWNTASTWNDPSVPKCGDSIIIQAGHIISLTNQINYTGCTTPLKIIVYGTLSFFNGSKLQLPCNSYIIVMSSGKVQADVGNSNSNYISICDTVQWNSNTILDGIACLPKTYKICAALLPVELVNFEAGVCDYSKICFNWQTVSERNNHHYEVERSSDALGFKMICKVPSKAPGGNSYYSISYSGVDETPNNGINYYRLKQVDNNQSSSFSKVISARLASNDGLQFLIYPNPNSGEFTAQITGLKYDENIQVLLRDSEGAIVYKGLHHVEANSSLLQVVPALKLKDGFYFCSFIIEETEYVVKIIVDGN